MCSSWRQGVQKPRAVVIGVHIRMWGGFGSNILREGSCCEIARGSKAAVVAGCIAELSLIDH